MDSLEKNTVPVFDARAEELAKILKTAEQFRILMSYYECAMMEVETKFKVLNESLSVTHDRNPIETIKCRLKDPRSIIDKMRRKNLSINTDTMEKEIRDIAGIRVICGFPEDVYLLANYLLKQDDIILVRVKDYIKAPKASGYRSLHLIVQIPIFLANQKRLMYVEIQLRTIAMDFWASLEHKIRYKKDLPNAEQIIRELHDCAEQIAVLDESMQNIRNQIEQSPL